MAEAGSRSSSKNVLTVILIAASTLILCAAIVLWPYLRRRSERQRAAELTARAQPILDAMIAAEIPIKTRDGKFWRDNEQAISAEGAKQTLNVDIATAPGFRFSIDPPDLAADPTLRIEAQGTGDAEGFVLACVYDSIAKTKNCKIV